MTSGLSDVIETITLTPEAGLINSLGANHTLESALADLIDNSIDAGATNVAVRLLTRADRLAQVEVIDNGRGMDAVEINRAMTVGHQRDYEPGDLGHFGIGLKAASFGHADVLTVWSTSSEGSLVGRRIRRPNFSRNFACEVLTTSGAAEAEGDRMKALGAAHGTTVLWSGIRNTYRGTNSMEARGWLSARETSLRAHLGTTFHRLLGTNRVAISVLVDDITEPLADTGVPVLPINPFGYSQSGHPGYPKELFVEAGTTRTKITCHVWPAKVDVTGFRIGKQAGEALQGFYIYRNDRLLQIGGWSETANPSPARQLARVVLDDSDALGPFLTMNPEKSGVKFEPIFHDAVARATAPDDTSFTQYLQDAESTYVEANRRKRLRRPVIRPNKGFTPHLRRRIGSELPFIEGDGVSLKWCRLPDQDFFQVDLPNKTLWLNSLHRHLFAPYGGSLNDAPVLKALMYLLTHHIFEGRHLGSRDKDDIALWGSVLSAAAAAEERLRED